jgi:hypothetical protein
LGEAIRDPGVIFPAACCDRRRTARYDTPLLAAGTFIKNVHFPIRIFFNNLFPIPNITCKKNQLSVISANRALIEKWNKAGEGQMIAGGIYPPEESPGSTGQDGR